MRQLKKKCWWALWLMALFSLADSAWSANDAQVLEKKLDFPSPIEWQPYNKLEISLIGVAWGRADSPQMLSKGREKEPRDHPAFDPDRTYAMALHFRAKIAGVLSLQMATTSGLALVKNVDGDLEVPMELTPSGFVGYSGTPGVYDIRLDKSNTTEYWDIFPVPADQKEFLFQVFAAGTFAPSAQSPTFSFRIVLKDGDIVIIGATPDPKPACLNFKKSFAGTVGSGVRLKVQLAKENTALSGTEQYERIGKTLWLKGAADSLGEFMMEERYPEDQVTGIFKGRFSESCRVMSGYFSKPDGSRLQPFEFHEEASSDKREPSQTDSEQQ